MKIAGIETFVVSLPVRRPHSWAGNFSPPGRGYVVQEGTAMGKNEGRVITINDNLVLVRETYVDYVGDKTTKDIPMRIRQGREG